MRNIAGITVRHASIRWMSVVVCSVIFAEIFKSLHFPAAYLLGAIVGSGLVCVHGTACVVPGFLFRLAQSVIGTLIAHMLPVGIMDDVLHQWPLFLAGAIAVIATSTMLGWIIARLGLLPGTTAVWGAAPGAATAMILMSGGFGADIRLVALMQYMRVVVVILASALVARYWVGISPGPTSADWFPSLSFPAFAATLLLIGVGSVLGHAARIPAGAMLLPFFAGVMLQSAGLLTITLPASVLVPAYFIVGWQVGSRFERAALSIAARALPALLASTLTLVILCALIAAALCFLTDVDPLTAYLATSPGGLDTIAIIGMAGHANMPFIMAMQTLRFLLVMCLGPWIARAVAGTVPPVSRR